MNKQIVFLSGRITGHDNYKMHFAEEQHRLTSLGYIVLNPAFLPEGMDNLQYMSICLAMLSQADAIYLLKGWDKSPGSRLEYDYAVYTRKIIMYEG